MWSYSGNEAARFDPTALDFNPTGDFYKDITAYCEAAKIRVHPCLRKVAPEDNPLMRSPLLREALERLNEEKVSEGTKEVQNVPLDSLTIFSKMVDKSTLYALKAVLPASQITTLRFSNNGFTQENLEVFIDVIAASKVSKLFFDWNPIYPKEVPDPASSHEAKSEEALAKEGEKSVKDAQPEEKDPPVVEATKEEQGVGIFFAKLIGNPKLQYLYLRANGITDEDMPFICEALKKNTGLRCIDFTLNHIKGPGVKLLAEAIKENQTLELLGLGSMELTMEDLQPLLNELGKLKITEEEAKEIEENNKELEKKSKVKKQKGKPSEIIPGTIIIEQDENGNYYQLRKENFAHLNIGFNNLNRSALEQLNDLLARTKDTFKLTAPCENIPKEDLEALSGKYNGRLIY